MNRFKQWYLKRTRFHIPFFRLDYPLIAEIRQITWAYEAFDKNGNWLCLIPIKKKEEARP